MTREDAIEKLRALLDEYDVETAHADADTVLADLLTSLGYEDVIRAWHAVPKWYA